jgi:hypothetical protein
MSDNRESNGGLLGLLGVGMVVCCGLPLLLGAGIAIGAAGLALGSSLIAAAGITLGVWGWRRRQVAQNCPLPKPGRSAGTVTSTVPVDPRTIKRPE